MLRKATLYLWHIAFLVASGNVHAEGLPKSILNKIPRGYAVLTHSSGMLNDDSLKDYLVVIHKPKETDINSPSYAAERPLLLFIQKTNGDFDLAKRNDDVVFRLDEGGQCDPFLDGNNGLAIKGQYFTVENGVACGQHWTDYITFKYEPALKNWVFYKRIFEESFDPGNPDGKEERVVVKAPRKHKILFEKYSK